MTVLGAVCPSPLVAVPCVVAGDEVVPILTAEQVRLQREVLVGAEVVDPELLRPWLLDGDAAIIEVRMMSPGLKVRRDKASPHAMGIFAAARLIVRLLPFAGLLI